MEFGYQKLIKLVQKMNPFYLRWTELPWKEESGPQQLFIKMGSSQLGVGLLATVTFGSFSIVTVIYGG